MNICDSIEAGFRELLDSVPYDKMTVVGICRCAHVSRKTFYEYFDNKEGIIAYIFDQRVLGPVRSLEELLDKENAETDSHIIVEKLYRCIEDDSEFWGRLVQPMFGHDDAFIRVATRAIYDYDVQLIKYLNASQSGWRLQYTAYFFASSQAMFLQKWIADGFEISAHDLADLYGDIITDYWYRHYR